MWREGALIISEEEERNTAYHEGGYALVAKLTPGTDPIHEVGIIPRGRALGVTQQLPRTTDTPIQRIISLKRFLFFLEEGLLRR